MGCSALCYSLLPCVGGMRYLYPWLLRPSGFLDEGVGDREEIPFLHRAGNRKMS